MKIAGKNEVVLELGARFDRDREKAPELLRTFLARSFDNVGGDRFSRADDLQSQRRVVTTTNLLRYRNGIERERVALLPNLQLPEIAHAERLARNARNAESLHLAALPFPATQVVNPTLTRCSKPAPALAVE